MRMRRPGFLLVVLLALAFSQNAGGPYPYLTLYLSAGVLLVSAVWVWASSRRLSVIVRATGEEYAVGDTAEVLIRVDNDSVFPVAWMRVRDESGAYRQREDFRFSLFPYSQRTFQRQVVLEHRGRYRLGPLSVRFGDPTGTFVSERRVEAPDRFVVYPRPFPVDGLSLRYRQPFGHIATNLQTQEDPTSLADVRPLAPGDSPRHIHWKVSAKRGELHVKTYELRATTTLLLLLDMNRAVQAGSGTQRTDEFAASVALGICGWGIRAGLPVGLLASGRRRIHVPPGPGRRHYQWLRERLIETRADGRLALADWLEAERPLITPRSSLVFVTPQLDRRLVERLARMRRAGHDVLLLYPLRESFDTRERPEIQRGRMIDALERAGVTFVRLRRDDRGLSVAEGRPRRRAAGSG